MFDPDQRTANSTNPQSYEEINAETTFTDTTTHTFMGNIHHSITSVCTHTGPAETKQSTISMRRGTIKDRNNKILKREMG